jgi:hypothetical protein
MTQHTVLLKIAMRAGEDPGIKVRGASSFAAGSMRPQCGSMANSRWGPSPRKLLNFRDFVGFQTLLPRSHFYYISVIMK